MGLSKRSEIIQARKDRGTFIPEEIQQPIRDRLRSIRLSRRLSQKEVGDLTPNLSTSAYIAYEARDLSTMQLHHLWNLSTVLGVDFSELIHYLFETEGTLKRSRDFQIEKVIRLMELMDEEQQEMVARMIDIFVDTRTKASIGNTRAKRAILEAQAS